MTIWHFYEEFMSLCGEWWVWIALIRDVVARPGGCE